MAPNMAYGPWSVLGLDGPADERAIRRAYAARLKVVRPDVDAAAFQQLVEARDAALRLAELAATRAPADQATPPQSLASSETSLLEGAAGAEADVGLPPPLPTSAEAAPRDLDPVAPPAMVLPHSDGPVTGSVDEGPEEVARSLSAFVEAWTARQQLPPVPPILKMLSEQPIGAHLRLEIDALRAVGRLLDKDLFGRAMLSARNRAARSLIAGLDEAYAWTENDRRLYMMLPESDADEFVRLLRRVRKGDERPAPLFNSPREWLGNLRLVVYLVIVFIAVTARMLPHLPSSQPATDANRVQVPLSGDQSRSQGNAPSQPGSKELADHFDRAVKYDQTGRFDQAVGEYDRVLLSDPNNVGALYGRGHNYLALQQLDRALQDFDQAIRLSPNQPDLFIGRGIAYGAKGQPDRAIMDYDQAIRLTKDNVRAMRSRVMALVLRGTTYTVLQRYDSAIEDLDQAFKLNPHAGEALYYRGVARQAKGEIVEGEADMARGLQISPSLPRGMATPPPPTSSPSGPSPGTAAKQ